MITENTFGPGRRKDAVFMTRFFLRAPRDLVFDALVEPEHLARWCGPNGFEHSVCEVELWQGGAHRTVLRGPDAKELTLWGTYREFNRPGRLVYTTRFDVEPHSSHEHVVGITLTEREGGTDLALTERLQSGREGFTKMRVGAWEANLLSLARLAELVESLRTGKTQEDRDEEWAVMPFECDDRVPVHSAFAGRRGALERFAALFRMRP